MLGCLPTMNKTLGSMRDVLSIFLWQNVRFFTFHVFKQKYSTLLSVWSIVLLIQLCSKYENNNSDSFEVLILYTYILSKQLQTTPTEYCSCLSLSCNSNLL